MCFGPRVCVIVHTNRWMCVRQHWREQDSRRDALAALGNHPLEKGRRGTEVNDDSSLSHLSPPPRASTADSLPKEAVSSRPRWRVSDDVLFSCLSQRCTKASANGTNTHLRSTHRPSPIFHRDFRHKRHARQAQDLQRSYHDPRVRIYPIYPYRCARWVHPTMDGPTAYNGRNHIHYT